MHFAYPGEDGKNTLYLSSDRKVHALWNIVSDAGLSVGVVNFWNTYPPEVINGVMVSDHLLARNIEGRRKMGIPLSAIDPADPRLLPLSYDPILMPFLLNNPGGAGLFVNFFGTFDASGKSTATLNLPYAGFFAGQTMGFAFLSFDPADFSKVHTVSASAHTHIH